MRSKLEDLFSEFRPLRCATRAFTPFGAKSSTKKIQPTWRHGHSSPKISSRKIAFLSPAAPSFPRLKFLALRKK
jgi:hypothetical protein